MTEKQKQQALNLFHQFFSANHSEFVQLDNAIKSEKNTTVKCLLICNAIDLLSQYYSGELKNNRTSKRFIELLKQCDNINPHFAELLFQFRNALCHHFGTFTYNHLADKKYHFKIDSNSATLFDVKNNLIVISDILLEELYFKLIEFFKRNIMADDKLLMRFVKVYKFIHP
jgi:hypothetical protein